VSIREGAVWAPLVAIPMRCAASQAAFGGRSGRNP
jgi:hypothetical protein